MIDEATMQSHYAAQPARFPLAYYRMKKIAHRYELVQSGDALLYRGDGVPSFLLRGLFSHVHDLSGIDLLFLPEDQDPGALDGFQRDGSSYRLVHGMTALHRPETDGIEIVQADPIAEAAEIAAVINRCYDNDYHTAARITEYAQQAEACPRLWLWAVDTVRQCRAGIFITHYDREMAEANLDWIQLLPEYRNRGIGKALIAETLSRLRGRAALITVGTQSAGAAGFYQKCGFAGVRFVHWRRIGAELPSYQDACRRD